MKVRQLEQVNPSTIQEFITENRPKKPDTLKPGSKKQRYGGFGIVLFVGLWIALPVLLTNTIDWNPYTPIQSLFATLTWFGLTVIYGFVGLVIALTHFEITRSATWYSFQMWWSGWTNYEKEFKLFNENGQDEFGEYWIKQLPRRS